MPFISVMGCGPSGAAHSAVARAAAPLSARTRRRRCGASWSRVLLTAAGSRSGAMNPRLRPQDALRSRWLVGALLVAVGSNAGCHGAPPPPPNPPYAARPVVEIGRFEARQDGALLGHLVHYEI